MTTPSTPEQARRDAFTRWCGTSDAKDADLFSDAVLACIDAHTPAAQGEDWQALLDAVNEYRKPGIRFTAHAPWDRLCAIAGRLSAAARLPEPQASKASEPYTPPPGTADIRCAMCGSGMMTRLELGRLRKRAAELEAALPSPASDKGKCPFSPGVCNDPKCPDCGPLVASAHPPASEAERPKCPECRDRGRVDVEDGRGNVVMDAACPRGCSALRAARVTGDILDRAVAWVEEKYPTRGHATGELLRECIAEISTLRHAARVTPPQQEDDRSWEKECEVRANGVVSCPSGTSITGSVYLVPDGRWLTYDQWLLLTPPSDRFPTESAARAALAKAPRPTP